MSAFRKRVDGIKWMLFSEWNKMVKLFQDTPDMLLPTALKDNAHWPDWLVASFEHSLEQIEAVDAESKLAVLRLIDAARTALDVVGAPVAAKPPGADLADLCHALVYYRLCTASALARVADIEAEVLATLVVPSAQFTCNE